jgi:hypothetical protein
MVTTTIANGQLLMRNRELLTLDEDKIVHEALHLSRKVWSRYQENAK